MKQSTILMVSILVLSTGAASALDQPFSSNLDSERSCLASLASLSGGAKTNRSPASSSFSSDSDPRQVRVSLDLEIRERLISLEQSLGLTAPQSEFLRARLSLSPEEMRLRKDASTALEECARQDLENNELRKEIGVLTWEVEKDLSRPVRDLAQQEQLEAE